MADHAIRGEVALACMDVLAGRGERILIGSSANSDPPLCALDQPRFEVTGAANLTSRQEQARDHDCGAEGMDALHGYSTTIVMFMLP
jgi:hypothetical protein